MNMSLKKIFLVCSFCFIAIVGSYAQFSIDSVVKAPSLAEIKNSQFLLVPGQKLGLLSYLKPEYSYHPTLGAFCVLENKIEKKVQFPVKMRLGDVDYVDYLENKRN